MISGFIFCEIISKGVNGFRKLDVNYLRNLEVRSSMSKVIKNMEVFSISLWFLLKLF